MAYNKNLGYDPDFDYSDALAGNNLSDMERSILEQQREVKIASQYAGKEPMYTTASGVDTGKSFSSLYDEYKSQTQTPQQTAASSGGYDLTPYLRQEAAARIESELAGLKGAYEQSMAGYNDALNRLPAAYDAARNQTAATNALEKRYFDEMAAANGLNSGTSGQAELARSSTLQRDLAGINAEQSNAEADLNLQKANLTSQYETAIQQAQTSGDADLANALYQELARVQGLQREDAQLQQQYAYAMEQDKRETAQKAVAYLQSLGITPDSELLAKAYGLTANDTVSSYISALTGGGTTAGSRNYDNGGLTAAQIKELQRYYGVTPDGLWGDQSRTAAGGLGATDAWTKYQAAKGGGTTITAQDITNLLTNNWNQFGSNRQNLGSMIPISSVKDEITARQYMKDNGVSSDMIAKMLTYNEWLRRKAGGSAAAEVVNYSTYADYARDYCEYVTRGN